MSWNYRVGKKTLKVDIVKDENTKEVIDQYVEDQYGIVECYYNDETYEIAFTSENFQEPYGETLEELKANLKDMQTAFDLPLLDLDNIIYAGIN